MLSAGQFSRLSQQQKDEEILRWLPGLSPLQVLNCVLLLCILWVQQELGRCRDKLATALTRLARLEADTQTSHVPGSRAWQMNKKV